MRTAEQTVRAHAVARLADDATLAGRVHGVFDGNPARATAPYIAVGAAEGSDWGTKDQPGREVRLTIMLHGIGESRDDETAAGIEQAAGALRGPADGWTIVSSRVVRTRFAIARDSGWRQEMVVRCRCLAG